MLLSVTNALLALVTALITWWYYFRRPRNLPPGPWGLPLVGYLPFIKPQAAQQFMDLIPKYGPVISFDSGSEVQVVISDFSILKKTFIEMGDVFAGRPSGFKEVVYHKDYTMLFNDGAVWREQRRFALSTMRQFGMGKSVHEPHILEEISQALACIDAKKGAPFEPMMLVSGVVANIVCEIALGRRFEYSDPAFVKMLKAVVEMMEVATFTGALVVFPWLRHIPFLNQLVGCDQQDRTVNYHLDFLRNIMDEHFDKYYSGKKDDYIDAYIDEKSTRKETNNYPEFFTDIHLLYDLQMLFLAGTETTTDTINWGFLRLMKHPAIQKKLHQEIDDVIGRERLSSVSDRINMPYMDAFIMELQRKDILAPLGLPHRVTQDVTVNGFVIPKNTTCLGNLYAAHHDPKLWGDPEVFRPERFINEKGQAVAPEYLVPFGMGKRQCVGEALARMEIFLILTCVLQKFKLQTPDGSEPDMKGYYTTVWTPCPYKMVALPRSQD